MCLLPLKLLACAALADWSPLPSPAKQTKTRKKTLLITQPPPAEFFYDDVHPASGPRSSR